MKRYFGLIVICLSLVLPTWAQEGEITPEVTSTPDVDQTFSVASAYFTVDDESYLVGEPITLRLTLEMPAEGVTLITWPELPEDWPPFQIIGKRDLTETINGDVKQIQQEITAVLWMPGQYQTSDTFIAYQITGEDVFNLPVLGTSVVVPTILDGVNFDLRPFKPPLALFFLSPLIITAGGFGLFYGLRWWREYRRRSHTVIEEIHTPHEIAVGELQELSKSNLVPEQLYRRAADCLRQYIQGRFDISAPDMTTHELLTTLEAQLQFPERLRRELHHLLEHADLVKFARVRPNTSASERLLKVARAWLDRVEAAFQPPVEEPPQ